MMKMIALVKSSSIINHKVSPNLQHCTLILILYFYVQHAEMLTHHQSAGRLPQAAGTPLKMAFPV